MEFGRKEPKYRYKNIFQKININNGTAISFNADIRRLKRVKINIRKVTLNPSTLIIEHRNAKNRAIRYFFL